MHSEKKSALVLACVLVLCWLLLGTLRGAGTVALNHDFAYGLHHLAMIEVWNAFFLPHFLLRSLLLIGAAIATGAIVHRAVRTTRYAEGVVAAVALAVFWLAAGMGELFDRTTVHDVMTSRIVISGAHVAILAIAGAAFVLTLGLWAAMRRLDRGRALALTGIAAAALLVTLGLTRFGVADAAANARRPNVVIISIDALRADHLSCYGYARPTSPRIDDFARSAVLYEHSVSQASSTHPSMASMLTSEYPSAFSGRPFKYVPYSVATVAEAMRNAGYTTGAVVSNVWLKSNLGFDQGFEHYDQDSAMSEFYADRGRVDWKNASQVSDAALDFLKKHGRERFFLWLHYLDPHHPYEPQPPFDKKFAQPRKDHEELIARLHALTTEEQTRLLTRLGDGEEPMPAETFQAVVDQYDGEIAFTDVQVGRVLDTLESLGVADDTMVVITADHGEEFREHGRWGHGVTLYEEVVHVPLIVRYPGSTEGRRVTDTVRTLDVAPTALAVAGLPVPSSMRGSDLRRLSERADRSAVSVCPRTAQLSVQTDGWKLITAERGHGSPSLYNLAADAAEKNDLAANEASRVNAMLALLVDRIGPRARDLVPEHVGGVDDDQRQQLQALGYLN
jgi:arylsulfatase A-like enzyme